MEKIRAQLADLAKITPKPKAVFFKTGKGDYAEHDQFIGVTVPDLRKLAREFAQLPFSQLQILLASKINEERLLALIILVNQYPTNRAEVYQFYLNNLAQVNNWNLVDASAHLIIGAHLHNQDKAILSAFAKSEIMWERRIAIVATWYFIKNSEYTTTLELAEILLNENHDLIHKAVGWMLREVGKCDVDILRGFLEKFSHKMPRTMLRYAIEKFSEHERMSYLTRV